MYFLRPFKVKILFTSDNILLFRPVELDNTLLCNLFCIFYIFFVHILMFWWFDFHKMIWFLICLFFLSHSKKFTHTETLSLPSSSNFDLNLALKAITQWEFIAYHTYCDARHPCYIPRPVTLTPLLLPSVWQWVCHHSI